jgi:RimJ/RimL family protein N-acetyltransferase
MSTDILLRPVTEQDLAEFFSRELDCAHVARMRTGASAPDGRIRTIVAEGQVVGYIAHFKRDGQPEVGYWIAEQFRGEGFATRALEQFLRDISVRPLYARIARSNVRSLRVAQSCGFIVIEQGRFTDARGQEVEEFVLELGESRSD